MQQSLVQLGDPSSDEVSSDEDDGEDVQDKQANKNVYIPPKLAAVHYSESQSIVLFCSQWGLLGE